MPFAARWILLVLIGLLALTPACDEQPSRQRSVLLITIDTLRAGYLGACGFDGGPVSPDIDALCPRSRRSC